MFRYPLVVFNSFNLCSTISTSNENNGPYFCGILSCIVRIVTVSQYQQHLKGTICFHLSVVWNKMDADKLFCSLFVYRIILEWKIEWIEWNQRNSFSFIIIMTSQRFSYQLVNMREYVVFQEQVKNSDL